ncbi:MAG TPA: PAS domain-containing sensor histidine kinase [Ktedonobacteraceae bacterium]|nr:PAS domain-containing sensor histidine kinase [Ktedonobacteraceae bacterium]
MSQGRKSQGASASSSVPVAISSTNVQPFLDISPDALVIVNQAGTIVMVNAQTEAAFGFPREALLGQPLELLLPERFHEAHVTHRNRYFSSPRTRSMGVGLQLVARRKDGTEFPVEISLSPLQLDNALHVIAAIRDITAQRAAERERLQQSHYIRQQAELINLAHDAILVRDPANRVVSWNRGAEEFYGWTAQEAQGRITHILLKTRFPTSRADVEAHLEQEGQWEGELTHTRRDRRRVIVESRQVLVRDEQGQPTAVLEINRDITQRRQLEQTAQTEHSETAAHLAFLQEVLDALPSAVYLVYGPDARLILANQATANVWGATWQADQPMLEFLTANGIGLVDMQGQPLAPERYATLRAVLHGETVLQQQEMIRRPGGTSLPVLVNAVALPSQRRWSDPLQHGDVSEPVALVMHQDMTSIKEAEYLKDEFLGIVAHELRTPLAVLKGFADMLQVQTERTRGPALTDWQKEALDEIKVGSTRLVKLTEDLLDVTRLQARRLILHRVPTNMVPFTQRVAMLLQRTTIRYKLEVHTTQPVLLAAIDPGRIEQILTNLIGNAIKYSPQGGSVTIALWEETATHMLGISVQDRGIGIPQHQHQQIFGRFMRADNTQAWGISGTGLGLYICHELAELHEGHLWFESEEGTGSTFFLTLPLFTDQEHSELSPSPGSMP